MGWMKDGGSQEEDPGEDTGCSKKMGSMAGDPSTKV